MIEKLIIVGNGYDLARQYKTSYSDFFDWLIIKFNIDSSQIKNIVELDDIDKLVQNLSEHECILKSNFWFAYMTLLKPNNSDWNNVEKIIETTLELIPNEINKLYDEDKNVIKAVADMGSNFEKKVLFTTLIAFHSINTFEDTIDFLFQSLIDFETLFEEYLYHILSKPYYFDDIIDTIDNHIISTTDRSNISILNFNYTKFSKFKKEQSRNIHGAILKSDDSPVIFGIDSTNISSSNKFYKFTKTARIMANGVGHSYSSILSHSIKDICFIGHSLNKADYSYFQSIFDYLSIYDSPVSLNFFYTTFHEKNAIVMQDYQHSIQILLDRYGETLDNKSHGDNLTAKLLLENRLNLIRIPV